MICRHSKNDPSCSSHKDYVDTYTPTVHTRQSHGFAATDPSSPDSENYVVEEAVAVDQHLVLKVKYPNCSKCSFEGSKVLVLLNVPLIDALKWRKIDPHFKDTKKQPTMPIEAPSPRARFPADAEGWQDALTFAHSKSRGATRTRDLSVGDLATADSCIHLLAVW